MAQEYWPNELQMALDKRAATFGMTYELRANIALRLIEHYGAVAGRRGEDTDQGRATMELQTPEELVERCWKIADLFIEEAEKRNAIKKTTIDIEGVYILNKLLEDKYWHAYRDDMVKAVAEDMPFDEMVDRFVRRKE